MSVRRWLALLMILPPVDASAFPRPTPRLDANGDPLPARAVVRLGSARFRHPGPLQAVAYSPDGKLVAAASADPPTVRTWERGTGKLRDEWRLPDKAAPEQLVFGPDGRRLYAGRIPGRTVPWEVRDLARRTAAAVGPTADPEFSFQALTPEGRHGFVVSGDRVLCWDLSIDQQVGSFERPHRLVADIGAPELGWVTISHSRTHYTATRLTDGKELWTVEGDWDGVLPNQPVCFAPDGRQVAIRTEAGRIGVYDTATGKPVAEAKGPEGAAVAAMRISPDGRTLAVSWKRKATALYDLPTGKERARLHDVARSPRDLAFAPDSSALVTADPDGPRTLLFFDPTLGTTVDPAPGHTSPVVALAVSPDGATVACATDLGGDPALAVWDVDTGRSRWAQSHPRLSDVRFSPDGTVLAGAARGVGYPVRLWDARTGRLTGKLDADGDAVRSLVFCRDGRLVAATYGRCRAWDWRTGRAFPDQTAVPRHIDRLVVEPIGRRVIVTTPDVFVVPFGANRTGDPDIRMGKTLTGFALSPDGRLLATADGGMVVRLWEVLSVAEAAVVTFPDPVGGVTFSPDGRTLAVATSGGTILFDLPTGSTRFTLPRGPTADTLVAFSGDGRRLVTAGNRECTATVWDVADIRRPPTGGKSRLGSDELAAAWEALADTDPKAGYKAVWKLATVPDAAVPFLARQLGKPLPDAGRINRLIADLDHPRFNVREQASRALLDIGEQVVDVLREVRVRKVSAEQAERIDGLLAKLAGAKPSPDRLRSARAVAVLELIESESARSIIRDAARGPETAPRTREAKAALDR